MIKNLSISFEFFPPKTPKGIENLQHTAIILQNLMPEFFSVTFGAGSSTREGTLQTVKMLQEKTNIPIAPHLSCIGSTRSELIDILQCYQAIGIKHIIALRGDIPSGMGYSGEFKHAAELISLIRETTGDYFQIEVAAYPEFHPQANNAFADLTHFKDKVNAGANRAITQYFFNADAYFYFVDACIKTQISIPIIPGIMPITQFAKLMRFSEACGAEIPRWIRKRFEAYGDDHHAIYQFGIEVIYNLCQKLIAGGAPGLHFYTLNHHEASSTLVKLLKNNNR